MQVYMRNCVYLELHNLVYEPKYTPSAFEEVDDGSRVARQPEAVQKAAEGEAEGEGGREGSQLLISSRLAAANLMHNHIVRKQEP